MKYFILLSIAIVIFIILIGYTLESSKSKCLAEGFRDNHGRSHVDHRDRNIWHKNNYNPPVLHGRYGPSTYGGMNRYGYFPIYTEYEHPVYYVDARNNFISDDRGILYYLFHLDMFFARLFGF
jgi:hypothetical protein